MLGLAVRTEYGMNPNILPALTPEPCDMEILDTMANKLSSEAERIWDFSLAFHWLAFCFRDPQKKRTFQTFGFLQGRRPDWRRGPERDWSRFSARDSRPAYLHR